ASASPYLALVEALRRWLDIESQDTPAQGLRKLATAVPEQMRAGEPFALLASFLGLAAQPPQRPSGNARQRLRALLVDWFGTFAGNRPSCLVVEDSHWVHPSMPDFVEHL